VPDPARPDPPACAACRELFPGLLDGGLAEADRRRAEAHLSRCAECRAALADLERLAGTGSPADEHAEPLDPRTREELLELFRSWRAGRRED